MTNAQNALRAGPQSESPFTVADLRRQGKAHDLVDVRQPGEFTTVHAAGARLVPLDQLDPRSIMEDRTATEEPVYLICKSGARSLQAQQRFAAAGFHNTVVVSGGTDGWAAAGCPVVRGHAGVSMERQVRVTAGVLVTVDALLGWRVSRRFLALPALVGAGLIYAGVTNTCGMAKVLGRMPWNRPA